MAHDLNTLELAHAIAQAVLDAASGLTYNLPQDPPTQAVLRVLRETNSWFCVIGETPQGVTTYQRMPDVQQELFR